jgi:transposase
LSHGGFKNAYIFGSVNPVSGQYVGTIFSSCSTEEMNIHLKMLSANLNENVHAVLILDKAGWLRAKDLNIPRNISLFHLPPYSPELNPIERLWLWLKNKYLSNKIFKDVEELLNSGRNAWQLLNEDLIKTICRAKYIEVL